MVLVCVVLIGVRLVGVGDRGLVLLVSRDLVALVVDVVVLAR